MARGSIATLAALACAAGAASQPPLPPPIPSAAPDASACLTVQSKVESPVLLARSCLENQTLAAGALLSLNVSANETLWVVPSGADWPCDGLCPGCFSLNAEVVAAPELGGKVVAFWGGFDEAPDRSWNGPAPAEGAENATNGTGAAYGAGDSVLGPENSTVARVRISAAANGTCLSVALEGPAEAAPTPLLRGAWHGGGAWHGPHGGGVWHAGGHPSHGGGGHGGGEIGRASCRERV